MDYICKVLLTGLLAAFALLGNSAGAGEKLNDATIFAIFDQANTMDIWTGRLGLKYGHSQEVRALAEMVVTDHEAVQQMCRDLAKKLGVVPVPPDDDNSADDHAKTIALLQSKSGREFDEAYLQREIRFHQSVIRAVKNTFLPEIESDEFKALVEKMLPGFKHHLAKTKKVAENLGVTYQ